MPENASTMLQNRLLAALLKNSMGTVMHLKEKLHSFLIRDPPLLSGDYLSKLSTITLELTALEASLTQTMHELEKEKTMLLSPSTVGRLANSASGTQQK